jgi:tetratricopeptide (TPR) repeat protein
MVRRLAFWLALNFGATMSLAQPVWAQSSASYTQCNNEGNAMSFDARISGCTNVIQSGRESGDNLAVVYNNRAIAYHAKGEYDRAIADYKKAIDINPRNADAYYNRAIVHDAKGEYDRAIADLSKAIEINPSHVRAYYNRGVAHEKRAVDDYRRVLSIDPDAQHAKDALSRHLRAARTAPQSGSEEWCAESIRLLGNPHLNQHQSAALLEKMRNRGCLN